MLPRLLAVALLTGVVWSPAAEASDKKLSWASASKAHWLRLDASLVTDLVIFPRVETGYGVSWHAGPELREARIGAHFQVARIWGGQLDLDLASLDPLSMDLWVESRAWAWLKIRFGRFKIPFGRIQQLAVREQLLLETPLVVGNSRDFRDTGLMLLGELWGRRVSYGLAMVTGSRDLAVDVNELPDLVGSLQLHPMRGLGPWLRNLGLGASFSFGEGPIRRGFRGRTTAGWTFINPPSIRGRQLRWGVNLEWLTHWMTFRAEYMWQRQYREDIEETQRVGTSMVAVGDLEPWTVHGFFTDLTVHVWGRRSLQGPLSGIELTARFESLSFSDGSRQETIPEGVAEHAPLTDSWIQGVSAGLNGYLGWGVRLSLLYQGLRFGRRDLAPDYDSTATPAQDPAAMGHWVHHVFLRAQWSY
ncbi:MAG: hypothetical protein RBU30_21360 [Polyangia bacterium]|jgi:hypothetical protein|nr:hypothetical protein [Polyangia bacterium]